MAWAGFSGTAISTWPRARTNFSLSRICLRYRSISTARSIHRTRIAFKRFRYMVEALSPLLPAVTDQHRHAMRGYQSMMGDIQDVEVMLATLDKFLRRKKIKTAAAGRLRNELLRRRQWLIQVYLNAAGRLRQFWPPPGLGRPAFPRRVAGLVKQETGRRDAGAPGT